MKRISQFDLWIADLNPRMGTEPGKVRPVIILQTDLLNRVHPSTIVCPLTTNVIPEAEILRVNVKRGGTRLQEDCDILIDQIRSIDNQRLLRKVGEAGEEVRDKIKERLKIILDLE